MHQVTDDTFEHEVLKSDRPVLVDFWAPWCAPCRRVFPVLQELAEEHGDALSIVKLNVDENPETAMRYQVTSIPAMKLFSGGEVVKTMIGAKPKPAIQAELAPVLAEAAEESASPVA